MHHYHLNLEVRLKTADSSQWSEKPVSTLLYHIYIYIYLFIIVSGFSSKDESLESYLMGLFAVGNMLDFAEPG